MPTPDPDIERQVIGNLVYQMNPANRVKFSYIRDEQTTNDVGSNWLRYMFDRTLAISKFSNTSSQYGLDWNHVFSASTYMDVKFKVLQILEQERVGLGLDHNMLDSGDLRDKYTCLAVLMGFGEVRRNPFFQILGLAHVEDFVLPVVILIDSGGIRQ